MKKVILVAGLGLSMVLVGCSSYRGGTGTEYNTTTGTAADMGSPGGLDRSRRGNVYENPTSPPEMPAESDVEPYPQ